MISLGPCICSPASSHSPSSAKTSQMHLLYRIYYTLLPPKYTISHPKSPPTCQTASAPTRLPHLALFISIYWCPLPLPSSPAILHTPALPSGTLGISTTLPAHPKDHIGKLIQSGTMAKPLFFGWWASPSVDI